MFLDPFRVSLCSAVEEETCICIWVLNGACHLHFGPSMCETHMDACQSLGWWGWSVEKDLVVDHRSVRKMASIRSS